jgi:hypothetical protein
MCHGMADNGSEGSSSEQEVGQDGMPCSSAANAIDSNQTTASSSVGRPLQVGANKAATAVCVAALSGCSARQVVRSRFLLTL